MKKVYFLLPIITLVFLTIISCKSDDDIGVTIIPPNDRGEQAVVDQLIIEKYLETHFYNYEEFANPPANFDFNIVMDTIAGENATKIPLIDQVTSKTVKDRFEDDVTYKLYYLSALEGEGNTVAFPDICTIAYEGTSLYEKIVLSDIDENNDGVVDNNDLTEVYPTELFDAAVTPVRFDLTRVVNGFQDTMIEFRTATSGPMEQPDGTVTYSEDFGVGVMFIPSGLAYFSSGPAGSGIGAYNQLMFTFKLYQSEIGDQDDDTIISVMEDLNNNGFEEDDDTDEDGFPNYADADDDGDGTLTIDEILTQDYIVNITQGESEPTLASNEYEIERVESVNSEGDDIVTITTITLTDTDDDGTPDYLDTDNS